MKKTLFLGAVLIGTLVCRAGDTSAPPASQSFKAAGTNIADAAKKLGLEVKEGSVHAAMEVKTGAVWVATQVTTGTVKVATDIQDSTGVPLVKDHRTVPELIAQAQADITAGKYRNAQNILDRLDKVKLTAEQQKTVDGLRVQIQKAFREGTPKPAGGSK